jgi:SAM-dependent methyltransferase
MGNSKVVDEKEFSKYASLVGGTYYGAPSGLELEQLRRIKFSENQMWLSAMNLVAGASTRDVVVEMGPGFGFLAAAAAPLVDRYLCVDINPGMLEWTKRNCAAFSNVEYLPMSLKGPLPFADGGFATHVVSFGVFIHFNLYLVDFYLQEFARVLRAGGLAVFNVFETPMLNPRSGDYDLKIADFDRSRESYLAGVADYELLHWHPLSTIVDLAARHGLEPVVVGSTPMVFRKSR